MTGGLDKADRIRTGGEDWHLHDERDLLQRSLDDAAREHGAGDLTDGDYVLLRTRDERRLAEVDAALAAAAAAAAAAAIDGDAAAAAAAIDGDVAAVAAAIDGDVAAGVNATGVIATPTPAVTCRAQATARTGSASALSSRTGASRLRAPWRRRWWLAALGLAAVIAAILLLVVDLAAPRLPGEDATGSISLNTAQTIERQLAQARTLVSDGKASKALQLYGNVLAEDPRQPVALAEWGWLDFRAATAAKEQTVAAEGLSALEEAVKVDPQLFAAQYYLGVVLYDEGAPGKAIAHFAAFLSDKPTRGWMRQAAPQLRAAYSAAHRPLPAGVPTG